METEVECGRTKRWDRLKGNNGRERGGGLSSSPYSLLNIWEFSCQRVSNIDV